MRSETRRWTDPARDDRAVATELWIPDGPGPFPLVVFSHCSEGHRRQSTFLAARLASHGYVVAAPDHAGNAFTELGPDPRSALRARSTDRVADLRFVLDRTLSELAGVREGAIAALGHGWGGWTALQLTAEDPRVRSVVGLAPAGGHTHLPTDCLREWLRTDWGRAVPALLIAAEHDSQTPLEGVRELAGRLAEPLRLLVLERADHGFFVDDIEGAHKALHQRLASSPPSAPRDSTLALMKPLAELCSPAVAQAAVQAVTLAHFDATLKGSVEAAQWLDELPVVGLRDETASLSAP